MPKPLLEECELAGQLCTFQDLIVGDHVVPLDVQDVSEAAHMEAVEFAFLMGMKSPGLTAADQSAQYTSSVDLSVGVLSQLVVLPHSRCQSGQGGMSIFLSNSWSKVTVIVNTRSLN